MNEMKWHIGIVEYHKLTSHVNYCRNDKNLEIFRFQQNKSFFHVRNNCSNDQESHEFKISV